VLRVTRGDGGHNFENDGALKNGGRLDVFELDSRRHDGDDSYLSTNELGDGAARDDGVRCLLPLPSGALLSGGSDACVRMWCPGEPGRSKVVSGPLPPGPRPTYDESREGVNGTPVLREVPVRDERGGNTGGVNVGDQVAAAAVRHDCHRDSVLCMAAVGTGMQRMLVTCGRDAAVKVWK
jgi:phosphoinositide-3-kinase regulatory subunit 4